MMACTAVLFACLLGQPLAQQTPCKSDHVQVKHELCSFLYDGAIQSMSHVESHFIATLQAGGSAQQAGQQAGAGAQRAGQQAGSAAQQAGAQTASQVCIASCRACCHLILVVSFALGLVHLLHVHIDHSQMLRQGAHGVVAHLHMLNEGTLLRRSDRAATRQQIRHGVPLPQQQAASVRRAARRKTLQAQQVNSPCAQHVIIAQVQAEVKLQRLHLTFP